MTSIPNLEGKIVTFDISKFGDLVYDPRKGTVLSRWLKIKRGDKLGDLSISFKVEKGACKFIHRARLRRRVENQIWSHNCERGI